MARRGSEGSGCNMKIYREKDADRKALEGRSIVVLGYGNQGRPQALNLRDSGLDVLVAARPDRQGWQSAGGDGFAPVTPEVGIEQADILLYLIPDEIQGDFFKSKVRDNMKKGSFICFAHGFAPAFGEIETDDYNLILVAPKGQGQKVRESYLAGTGVPALLAAENEKGMKIALAIALALGSLRVGGFRTTFREEAVSDLFGEQAVLCGGVTALMKSAFDTLVDAGFSPEVAYFECVHELKIIVDILYSRGFNGMRKVISKTAAYGGLKYGEGIIGEATGEKMKGLLEFIESGGFAADWMNVSRERDILEDLINRERNSLLEETGAELRKLFPENY